MTQVTIVLLDVNDMSPEFISPTKNSIIENAPSNTVVMAIKAVDRDEGRNGYVEYSLENDTNLPFTLGPVDGLLRVSGPLDREQRSNYTLEITAKDRGEPPRSSSTTVTVIVLDENDNSPIFDSREYFATVAENASIGASVLQVCNQLYNLEKLKRQKRNQISINFLRRLGSGVGDGSRRRCERQSEIQHRDRG